MRKIIDKVCYCMRHKDLEVVDLSGKRLNCIQTFVYNPQSKQSPKTAKEWAQRGMSKLSPSAPQVLERDNEPFEVRVVRMVTSGQGNATFQVIDNENRLLDLQSDQFLDAMNTHGIKPGGVMSPAQFVWGQDHSSIRMVFFGGKLHSEMISTTKQLALPTLKGKDLVPGHLYQKIDNEVVGYLGRVRCPDNKQLFYAFVQTEDWHYLKHHNEKLKEWHSLSWSERIEQLIAAQNSRGENSDVLLATTPPARLISDVGTFDATLYRGSKQLRFETMLERSLSERWWSNTKNEGRPRESAWCFYDRNRSTMTDKQAYAAHRRFVIETEREFASMVEWK
jgi:hypothetical protein